MVASELAKFLANRTTHPRRHPAGTRSRTVSGTMEVAQPVQELGRFLANRLTHPRRHRAGTRSRTVSGTVAVAHPVLELARYPKVKQASITTNPKAPASLKARVRTWERERGR